MSRPYAVDRKESSGAENRTSIGNMIGKLRRRTRSMTRWSASRPFSRGIAYSISVNLTLRWVAKTL
ncbi:Uncharacterised protein [Mycobacterium tuberculosis]|nr:Uncharacterised protein [Mycobacterium tuberculosis]COW90834.1 Uncharacterised protein [Mycobacterium tuberculosis]COX05130.1 Uncharacterised protein [Mycobacterium tuberculosis]